MTREDLFAALARRPVPFTAGSFSCHLRPLAASERNELVDWQRDHGADANYQWLFARGVCDADGNRLLTDEDAPAVAGFASLEVDAVVDRIMDMNGLKPKPKPPETDEGKAQGPTLTPTPN